MDALQDWFVRYGIVTQYLTLSIPISDSIQNKIPLPKTLPTDIGRIVGLSTYADTVDPENNTLISTAQAQLLYLTLKSGSTEFFQPVRLDDLLFTAAGIPNISGERWFPVNFPGNFDISNSYISNPTSIVSAAAPATPTVIMLNLRYVNANTYTRMLAKDLVWQNAVSQSDLKK